MDLPTVWYVDDLNRNLEQFEADHRGAFRIRRFTRPQQIIDALKESKPPDALLCDIFFYDTEEESERIEEQVQQKARELRAFANSIGADRERYQAGITLIENVFSRFKGKPPFPVYAYTSKGPYILDASGFDRIGRAGAKWLFKGKYSAATQELVINNDIEEVRFFRYVPRWLHNLWGFAVASGIVGWCLIEFVRFLAGILIHMGHSGKGA